jgi:hypothetical protein
LNSASQKAWDAWGKISVRDAWRRHRRSRELVRSFSLINLESMKRQ